MASKDEIQILMLGRQALNQLSYPSSMDKIFKHKSSCKEYDKVGPSGTQEQKTMTVAPGPASLEPGEPGELISLSWTRISPFLKQNNETYSV